MKLFKSAPFYFWLVLGVFLMVYLGFGMFYFQKHAQSQSLQLQTAPNRILLQKPGPDTDKLERQLTQAETQLKAKWTFLPTQDKGLELVETLVTLAVYSDVEVTSVAASTPVKKQSQGATYMVLPYTITVQGTQNGILAFSFSLAEKPELNGMEVESVSIATSRTEGVPYSATLQLVIPTQPQFTAKPAGS